MADRLLQGLSRGPSDQLWFLETRIPFDSSSATCYTYTPELSPYINGCLCPSIHCCKRN
jgi:hypothetical protein